MQPSCKSKTPAGEASEEGGVDCGFQAVQEGLRGRREGVGFELLEFFIGVQGGQDFCGPFEVEHRVEHPQAGEGGPGRALGGVVFGVVVLQHENATFHNDLQEVVEFFVVDAGVGLHQHLGERKKKRRG